MTILETRTPEAWHPHQPVALGAAGFGRLNPTPFRTTDDIAARAAHWTNQATDAITAGYPDLTRYALAGLHDLTITLIRAIDLMSPDQQTAFGAHLIGLTQ